MKTIKHFGILFALLLMVWLLSVGQMVMAAEEFDVNTWEKLEAALESSGTSTINVKQNINQALTSVARSISIVGNKTLNLNGYTVKASYDESYYWAPVTGFFNIESGGMLTINNGKIIGANYSSGRDRHSCGVINVEGTLTTNNVDITNARTGSTIHVDSGTVNLYGGRIQAGDGYALDVQPYGSSNVALFNGVILTTPNGTGVYEYGSIYGYGAMYWRYNGGTLRIQDAEFLGGISVPPNIREAFSISTHRIEFAFQEKDTYKVLTYDIPVEYEGLVANPSAELYWNDWDLILAHYTEASYIKKLKVAESNISSVSVTLAAPKIGAAPDYTATFPSGAGYYSAEYNTNPFRNDIKWWNESTDKSINPDAAVFASGYQYTVYVYLTAKDGYAFTGSTTATLNGQPAEASVENGQLLVQYTFPALTETISSVSVTLDAPKIGAKPDYTAAFPSGAPYFSDAYNEGNYRNDIGWWDEKVHNHVNPDTAVFAAGIRYTVYVYLTAQDGYAFTDSTTATLNGQPAETSLEDGQLCVMYPFAAMSVKLGDLNSDGSVNQKDLAMLSKYMRNKTLYPLDEYAMAAADINGDGSVNQKDLAILSKYMRNPTAYPLP